ncbi:MAG: hypothetical protein JXA99_03220 [Candidatus Lokiarchaeota archaeon]|nr:hypothetical protein [Candidatus Lokiarchaeota archaeon]
MISNNNNFKALVKKKSEEINKFLIERSKNPNFELKYIIDYLISNLSTEKLKNVKINLIYLIGKLSQLEIIDNELIQFLTKQFQISDKWERREITKSFKIISKNQQLDKEIINVLASSLQEDYVPIVKNILKIFQNASRLNKKTIKNIIRISKCRDQEVIELKKRILHKVITSEKLLFNLLDNKNFYKRLDKISFRDILISIFREIGKLEAFKNRIKNSNWSDNRKTIFLDEIAIFQKILPKVL